MKTYPNKQRYHQILKTMSPEEKVIKVFELSELSNEAIKTGLRNRYKEMPDEEFHQLYLERRSKCHNQNY